MTALSGPQWQLRGFEGAVLRWFEVDNPSANLSLLVTDWWFTRLEDPFAGAKRDGVRDSGWYAQVPGSVVGGYAVLCSWVVLVSDRTVTCDSIATLSLPIM